MGGRVVVRILALASTPRGFGFVVMEGPQRLVDWGLCRCSQEQPAVRARVDALLDRYRPTVGVTEDLEGTLKRERGRTFMRAAEAALDVRSIRHVPVSYPEGFQRLAGPAATKWQVAQMLAERFPEISHRMPRRRKPWEEEDARFGLFVACALALGAWERVLGGSANRGPL